MPEQDNYDDELVSSNPNQRNWRGILIALLVIIIVLALIVTSVVLLTPPDEGPRVKGQRIKLQDIVDGAYIPHRANGTWINAEEFIYQDQWGRISLLNVGNLSDRVLMSNLTIKTLSPSMFTISPDKSYILLAQNIQKIYRHSYLAQYTVFDIQTSESIKLKIDFGSDEWPYLQYAQFTPSGSAIIVVYNYNIYYLPRLRPSHVFPITRDGVPGVIYNGIPDWLYEEEILESNNAIWMSADGHLMLYASFNDTNVQEQYFAWYGSNSEHGVGNSYLYPEIKTLRYPKPGTQNPTVHLRIADLANPKDIRYQYLKPPHAVAKEDHYVASASWISQTEVCVVWLNRPQNISIISICKSPLFHCLEIQKISGDGRGWVDTLSVPLFAKNASSYVTIAPLRDGGSGYFRHIVHVQVLKRHVLPLTHGQYEVNKLLHWDQINHFVYFLGTPERKPAQQHLYRVSAIPPRLGSPLLPPQCLTCPPSKSGTTTTKPPPRLVTAWDDDWEDGPQTELPTTTTQSSNVDTKPHNQRPQLPEGANNCLFYTALFPNTLSAKYVLMDCLGPVIPTSAIYLISAKTKIEKLPTAGGILGSNEEYLPSHPMQLIMTIQNNTRLRNKIEKTALPQIKTFPVVVSGGYHAQVRIFLPPVLREDEITRYPTILHVYSGPGTQLVTEKWHIDWNTYLSAAKDYIVIQIDGRGSSGQGYQLLHEVYKRLGTVEVSDQLEVSEYLRDNLHFIDGRRMGVWGWSYGGYTAALTLANSQSIFQCGISVAPVSNWKLYDSTYSERYLSFPNVTDNYKGYEEGDLTKYVDNLRDKQFLLVHGTADDNVHLQQSMFLSRALTAKGVLYKQQIYPDEGHSLSGVKRHLYRSMTAFFDDCFKKLVPPEIKAGLGNGGEPQQQ